MGALVNSLTDGFDDLKDAKLGLRECGIGQPPHYRHRETFQKLCKEPPIVDGNELGSALFDRLVVNWSKRSSKSNPSRQNWRFTQVPELSPENVSPEVTFERFAVGAAGEYLANQVPTCAGILSPSADTRRSIDLVEKISGTSFDLIELKIVSDTPLYAALEVLDYAAIYVFCRSFADELGYEAGFSPLLEADKIGLRVLAPIAFYNLPTGPAAVGWLDEVMNAAAQQLAEIAGDNLRMDFRFDCFSDDFSWDPALYRRERSIGGDYALAAMQAHRALDTKTYS